MIPNMLVNYARQRIKELEHIIHYCGNMCDSEVRIERFRTQLGYYQRIIMQYKLEEEKQ